MKRFSRLAKVSALSVCIFSPGAFAEFALCNPYWLTHDFQEDVVGSPVQELTTRSSRKTINLVDGSGLATMTLEQKVAVVADDGTTVFKTPWLSVESAPIFESDGYPGPDIKARGPNNGKCEGRRFATYDSGAGPEPFLVTFGGILAQDNISGTDLSRVKVWVHDMSGVLQNKFDITAVQGWEIHPLRLQVADFNGDGSDDLMITQQRESAPGSTLHNQKTKVFDLLSGALLKKIDTSYVYEEVNLNLP